ncbi:universal stress protein [Loigolactobacillus iwatensis]|uniref:universal stress protein n=1 Tax=Loigolactobacillus iwatensis TaxID=1267156 RepID=UPI000F7DDA1A|nr:universal stress protein [Loigolactobacillus iwatensis]
MVEKAQVYQTILVGIDGSEQAKRAFEKAVETADRNRAKLIIAYVVESQAYTTGDFASTGIEMAVTDVADQKQMLHGYLEQAKKAGIKEVQTVLAFGSPRQLMSQQLPKQYHIDLIMVGQSGLNAVERFMMGSVSAAITRDAPCDVLIIRSK